MTPPTDAMTLKDRERDPNADGYSLGGITTFAIGMPIAGVAMILSGKVWIGILLMLCGLAFFFMAYVFWTRRR